MFFGVHSLRVSRLQASLPIDPELAHYRQCKSYDKALELLENSSTQNSHEWTRCFVRTALCREIVRSRAASPRCDDVFHQHLFAQLYLIGDRHGQCVVKRCPILDNNVLSGLDFVLH
jgi:hypothetical protein